MKIEIVKDVVVIDGVEYRRKPCTLTYTVTIPELLERIMVVVAAAEKAEREACARLCDEVYRARRVHGAQDCAAAIRARGNA